MAAQTPLNFVVGDEVTALVEGVQAVLGQFPQEYWAHHDAESTYPRDYVDAMARGGWLGLTVPESFGGGGLDHVAGASILRAIAASGAGLNGCIPVHMSMFAAAPIVEFGDDALKQSILPEVVSGDITLCFMVSEPDTGSDTSRLATKATPTADGWTVSGQKMWITQAIEADVAVLLARTEPAKDRFDGMSLFLLDMKQDQVSASSIPKLPHNALRSCEVFLSEALIHRSQLVGTQGEGFRHVLGGLNSERILMAAEMVGIGHAALEKATTYANERQVFGRAIGSNQAISLPLARAEALLWAAWLSVLEAAAALDAGLHVGARANRAKYLAADACWAAADAAMQTFGGMGFAKEAHVERYFREARLLRVAPVSQELALSYLSTSVLGLPRAY